MQRAYPDSSRTRYEESVYPDYSQAKSKTSDSTISKTQAVVGGIIAGLLVGTLFGLPASAVLGAITFFCGAAPSTIKIITIATLGLVIAISVFGGIKDALNPESHNK